MEIKEPKFSYTFRSLNIAAASCLLAIFLAGVCVGFMLKVKITSDFAIICVIFLLWCAIAYFLISGIAFYFRERLQECVPAWLFISFFGSATFVLSAEIVLYIYALNKINKTKELTSVFSESSTSRVLPSFSEFVTYFLIYTLILFVLTGFVSSISSLLAKTFREKKKEDPYTFLEL